MEVVLNDHGLQILNLFVAFILPAVVAFVTKRYADGLVKTLVLTTLTVLLSVLSGIFDDGGFVVFDTVMLFVQNMLIAVVSHFGILKPTGITGSDGAVARALPGGIGPKTVTTSTPR